jgi:preprotein translocase subunit YajC
MNLSFIPTALAANAPQATSATESINLIIMLIAFVAIFYFLILRPQNKRAREHRELIGKLAKDDEVITAGGILGRITKITDDFVVLCIAEGVEIKIQKSAIANSIPKGTLKTLD